jgi:mRNA interferase MazF
VGRAIVFPRTAIRSLGTPRAREISVEAGEIRWYTFRLPDKRRPVLVLTRNEVIDHLNEIIVVPATRTIRGLTTEVVLTTGDGMPAVCALNFDRVALAQRDQIGPALCSLPESRWIEIRRALLIACGFDGPQGGLA